MTKSVIEGELIIAVDFDGTITTNPDISDEPLELQPNCKKVLTRLYERGARLILWTCRTGNTLLDAIDFLNKMGMCSLFETINEQIPEVREKYYPDEANKVGADIYIDDKNLGTKIDWLDIERQIYSKVFDKSENLSDNYNFQWQAGEEPRTDNTKLIKIMELLSALQYHKEGDYGSSWKGKGEYRGIMANIDRKYDRLDIMTQQEINGERKNLGQLDRDLSDSGVHPGESKVDAIADLANYCLLYMTYIMDEYPNLFNEWVQTNVPAYLREKISL